MYTIQHKVTKQYLQHWNTRDKFGHWANKPKNLTTKVKNQVKDAIGDNVIITYKKIIKEKFSQIQILRGQPIEYYDEIRRKILNRDYVPKKQIDDYIKFRKEAETKIKNSEEMEKFLFDYSGPLTDDMR